MRVKTSDPAHPYSSMQEILISQISGIRLPLDNIQRYKNNCFGSPGDEDWWKMYQVEQQNGAGVYVRLPVPEIEKYKNTGQPAVE